MDKKEIFIKKANLMHNNKYDYSLVDYVDSKTKIIITCPIHGNFNQTPDNHLHKHSCPNCNGGIGLTRDSFIKKAKETHNNKYDYSLVEYKNNHTKINIICPFHGSFKQRPNDHLNGNGCQKCGVNKRVLSKQIDKNYFINKANLIHKNKYDYSLVNYINVKTKVNIICNKHGEFKQIPNSHLNGSGCPRCCESKGETSINIFLNKKNINFIPQKRFKDCRNILPLPFDFYLPEHNICIEYDGEQHFKPLKKFGGVMEFEKRIHHDKIKTDYCLNNNIKLIRVSYLTLDNLDTFLVNSLSL